MGSGESSCTKGAGEKERLADAKHSQNEKKGSGKTMGLVGVKTIYRLGSG